MARGAFAWTQRWRFVGGRVPTTRQARVTAQPHSVWRNARSGTARFLARALWPNTRAVVGPYPRGGAYTYDWIENLLKLNMHSVAHVLPEFQDPQVGDGFGLGANQMRYARVEPERVLALRSLDGNWVWSFVLEDRGGDGTRLLSRNRFRLPTLKERLVMLQMEPGPLVMERKMLHGIKQRAERLDARTTRAGRRGTHRVGQV